MKKSEKSCKLDRIANQRLMLHHISIYGKEDGCWEGICCDRTYKAWKKQHAAEWEAQIEEAQARFYNSAKLKNPMLYRKLVNTFWKRAFEDKLSNTELMQALKFLKDFHED